MGKLADLIYGDLIARGKKEDTALHWKTWTERFEEVCGTKDRYDRQDLIKFLAWERKKGFTQNSINTHLRPIKLLAQLQDWKFPQLSMPKVKKSDINRTIFSKMQVISMIQTGRQILEPKKLSYLALSTTYGPRREEMCEPEPPDIGKGAITFHTIKGGPTTTHLIPAEIEPFLEDFRPYSADYMSHMFRQICYELGIKVGDGYGWHSIRRSLATELLVADASALNITRFMRWSETSLSREFGMLAIYAQRDQVKVDQSIFRKHPFLPYWGTGESREMQKRSKLQSLLDFLDSPELSETTIDHLLAMAKTA